MQFPSEGKEFSWCGGSTADFEVEPPHPSTSVEQLPELFADLQPAVSVQEALSDLPSLEPGEDGSSLDYEAPPNSVYQALMRGLLGPDEYLKMISDGERLWTIDLKTKKSRYDSPSRLQSRS